LRNRPSDYAAIHEVLRHLENRLRLRQCLTACPEIAAQPVPRPVFVVGLRGAMETVRTDVLEICYETGGPPDGELALLIHRWPDAPPGWDEVARYLEVTVLSGTYGARCR
jgi:hypothetical protein